MLIQLEFKNRVIERVESSDLTSEIVIGRGKQCTWRIPQEDGVISNQHCRIFLKGNTIWIEDLGSTNGLYIKDKRIAKKKLSVG